MTAQTEVCSILAVDIGSSRTKASLFELVEGRHRFVARADVMTTLYNPIDDVSVGARQAVEKIEKICGRTILSSDGPIVPEGKDGTGIDFFVTTTSIGRSLRLLVTASSAGVALANQLKRFAELCAVEVELLLLDRPNGSSDARLSDLSKALVRFRPHAIFVIGDGSASSILTELGQEIVEAISAIGQAGVPVRFLGESSSANSLEQGIRGSLDFRPIGSGSIASSDDLLAIQHELAELWEQHIVREIPGYPQLISWQNAPVEHSFFALGDAVRFWSSFHKADVLAVDIGSSSVSLFKASQDGSHARLSYKYGVGRGATGLLNGRVEAPDGPSSKDGASVRRWLPFALSGDEIGNLILNKWARPWTMPETAEEMLFERALGVESVRRVRAEVADQPHFFRYEENGGMVIGSGSVIVNQNSVGRMVLTLLDALEPAGVFRIAIDRDAVLPQLGAVGRAFPQEAAEVLLEDALLELGTCLACVSGGRPGSKAATVEIRQGENFQKIDVLSGEIRVVRLPAGKTAEVRVEPVRGVDFAWGKGKSGKLTVHGAALGLIIDARGRPVQASIDKHSQQVERCLESLEPQEGK